jgi:hypothetical protein
MVMITCVKAGFDEAGSGAEGAPERNAVDQNDCRRQLRWMRSPNLNWSGRTPGEEYFFRREDALDSLSDFNWSCASHR